MGNNHTNYICTESVHENADDAIHFLLKSSANVLGLVLSPAALTNLGFLFLFTRIWTLNSFVFITLGSQESFSMPVFSCFHPKIGLVFLLTGD